MSIKIIFISTIIVNSLCKYLRVLFFTKVFTKENYFDSFII